VEFAGVEQERLAVVGGDAVLIEVVDGGGFVDGEDLEVVALGGEDDGLVAGIFGLRLSMFRLVSCSTTASPALTPMVKPWREETSARPPRLRWA
jgi:hypothetical protein